MALESGVPVVPVAIHGSLGVRKWRKLRFPKVTVQYGEPMTFGVVANPSRGQQQEAAERIFDPVRQMYEALEKQGRAGVIKALRRGAADAVAGASAPHTQAR
jgi:1-acyl-sn-glycerol-3-phosphate acyltransferase